MSRYHLASTSRALYRVFVAPNLPPRVPLPTQPYIPFLPLTATRTVVRSRKPVVRQAISDLFTFDNAIDAPIINLIDEQGRFTPNVRTDDARRRINRVTHHLYQVKEGQYDEFGDPDPNNPPVCRIISKIDLRSMYNKKIEMGRKKGPVLKNLELNWAIAGGDLKHRLEKLKGFLKDGKKVEILLGPKKRGKKATEAECQAVLKAVLDAVDDCKGANEIKREGVVGGVFTVVFQGKKLNDNKAEEKDTESG